MERRDAGAARYDQYQSEFANFAELAAIERAFLERLERLSEARRQQRPVGGIRLIVARAELELSLDAIEAGDDLGCDIEVRIGRRLAHAIFQPRRGLALAA